jgi:hypothetical protein
MKKITIILFLITSTNIFSQNIIRYESDFTMKFTIDPNNESPDGGSIDGVIKNNVNIIHNTLEQTLEINQFENGKNLLFYKNLRFKGTFFSKNEKYKSYYAIDNDANKYFISFAKTFIKIDHRAKFKGYGFHLKN